MIDPRRPLKERLERFRQEIRVYRAALQHPRTPRVAKWLLRAAIAYAMTPIDLVPDFIPILGHLDDAIIVPGLIVLAVRLIPRDVVAECRAVADQERESTSAGLV